MDVGKLCKLLKVRGPRGCLDGVTNPIAGVQVFVPFEITSWQKVYGNVYAKASDVFNAPFDGYMETLFPSLLSPSALYALLPAGTPALARDKMFQSAYLNDLATNLNNNTIIAAKKQDLPGWNPKDQTTLCGGSGDRTVKFIINAQTAYNDFTSRGATNVALVDVDPQIRSQYAALFTNNSTAYFSSYHSPHESPFCCQVAKKLFDLHK